MQTLKRVGRETTHAINTVPSLVLTLFVLSVVGMNLLANKSIDTGISWLALDCGIVFSGMAFLSMDVLAHCYGPKTAMSVSIMTMILNLMMSLFFFAASSVPGAWGESFASANGAAVNLALDHTFGGTWYIILGSSVAFCVSATINNAINWAIGERVGHEGFGAFALRSYVSTFIAQFADNLTFAFLVSRVFFGWSLVQCVSCALVGAVLELLFEVLFSPLGYRVSQSILAGRSGLPAQVEMEAAC